MPACFYADYDRHPDDRLRLFSAVATLVPPDTPALYPDPYVDIGPSVLIGDVTHVDEDARAGRFFADDEGVRGLIGSKRRALGLPEAFAFRFEHADYRERLPVADGSVALLVSLYAGFVSEHCSRYLATDGLLFANSSHGDVSMATLEPSYSPDAVVKSVGGGYRATRDRLGSYLVPTRRPPTHGQLRGSGPGIGCTRSAYAYLFRRASGSSGGG